MDSINIVSRRQGSPISCARCSRKLDSLFVLLILVWCFGTCSMSIAEETADGSPDVSSATQVKRPLWINSHIRGTPDPPDPYRLENAFQSLALDEPLAISRIEGTHLFIIAQRYGKIFTLEDKPAAKPQVLMYLERVVYGVAAHPDFLQNGRLFVSSVIKEGEADGTRVPLFEWTADDRCRRAPRS